MRDFMEIYILAPSDTGASATSHTAIIAGDPLCGQRRATEQVRRADFIARGRFLNAEDRSVGWAVGRGRKPEPGERTGRWQLFVFTLYLYPVFCPRVLQP